MYEMVLGMIMGVVVGVVSYIAGLRASRSQKEAEDTDG